MTRIIASVRFLVTELISLIADDPVIVVGAAVALGAGAWLGHAHGFPRVAVGVVVFALVWATLAASLWRTTRPSRDRD